MPILTLIMVFIPKSSFQEAWISTQDPNTKLKVLDKQLRIRMTGSIFHNPYFNCHHTFEIQDNEIMVFFKRETLSGI